MKARNKLILEICASSAGLYFLGCLFTQQLNLANVVGVGASLTPLLLARESGQVSKLIQIFNHLSCCSTSAGMIDNQTDEVIWRNPASQAVMEQWKRQNSDFQPPSNTKLLHDYLNLKQLKKEILALNPVIDWNADFFYKTYTLAFPGIGFVQVQDKFYRVDFNNQVYRIWVNLSINRI